MAVTASPTAGHRWRKTFKAIMFEPMQRREPVRDVDYVSLLLRASKVERTRQKLPLNSRVERLAADAISPEFTTS